jgi:two-component system LytT family sensor kinase
MPTKRLLITVAAWILFWMLLVITAVQDYLRNHDHGVWKPILWETSSALIASFLIVMQRRATRKHDHLLSSPLQWFARQLVWLPVYWVVFVPAVFGIRHAVYAAAGDTYTHEAWLPVFIYEDIKISVFFCTFTTIIFGVLSYHAMQNEKLRVERANAALREAQLLTLTQQMQPHFLFNALNTISSLMHSDVARADAMLIQLADVLRATLDVSGQHSVSLEVELRLLRGYAALMSERFSDRVRIGWDIDETLLGVQVPVMSMQPLLENIFKHTVEKRRQPTAIAISVLRDGDEVVLRLEDDGGTLPAASGGVQDGMWVIAPEATGGGIGVRNLRERLAALYGERAAFNLTQLSPTGVRAEMRLPCA